MKHLPIVWQRLLNESGATCPRCAGTQQEVQQAVDRLRATLAPGCPEPSRETHPMASSAMRAGMHCMKSAAALT